MLRRVAFLTAAVLTVAGCGAGPGPARPPAQTPASAAPSSPAAWPRAMYMCRTDGSTVPVYAFPDVRSGVVDVLDYGDRVTILGVVDGWGTVEGLTAVFYVEVSYLVSEMCGD
jgi:hypothetical protein